MLGQEGERHVKARLDRGGSSGQTYETRGKKIAVGWKDLPKGDMIIESAHNSSTSSDEDVEGETYVQSAQAPHHKKAKVLLVPMEVGQLGMMRKKKRRFLMWRRSFIKLIST
jgi:hypothetical protein